MYTSIVLVALAGSTLSAPAADSLAFSTDYVAARELGSRERKPLAVFIGQGPKGWEQRTTDGQLSQGVQKLLQAHYVYVYLDTDTEDGRRLSADFNMKSGLVIGDATGENQAFRHTGSLSNSDLEIELVKFSDPNRVAVTTETKVYEDVRYYPQEPAPAAASIYLQPAGYCPSCNRR